MLITRRLPDVLRSTAIFFAIDAATLAAAAAGAYASYALILLPWLRCRLPLPLLLMFAMPCHLPRARCRFLLRYFRRCRCYTPLRLSPPLAAIV